MYTSSFSNLEDFNNFLSRFDDPSKTILLTKDVHALVSLKQFDFLRTLLDNDIDTYQDSISSFLSEYTGPFPNEVTNIDSYRAIHEATYSSSESSTVTHRLFPYSKQKFIETFMYDMFPSFRNDLYTYLTNNLILFKQIGSGAGSSVIIKTYKPTNQTIIDEINSFCSIDSQVQSINSTISKVSSVLQKQNLDIQFMNEYISKLENLVTTLSNQLENERKQGVNGFYRTWH